MAHSHFRVSADRIQPLSEGERELAHVLALLEGNRAGSLTIATLRERGVKAPAQAVYDLQLAGYAIDRVSHTGPGGQRSFGYRLNVSPAGETFTGLRDADDDGIVQSAKAP
jgi:hypothetical protein